MRLTYLILIAISLFCTGCYQSFYTADTLPEERLEFGTGDDIAYVEHFILLKSGQILRQNIDQDTFFQVKMLDRAIVKSIFFQRDSIRLLSYDHYLPGTSYQFINQIDSRTEHNIAWMQGDERTPEAINYFYELLLDCTVEKTKENGKENKGKKSKEKDSFGW